jgi:DNA-binding beta-propeller fold protein YncE
MLVGWALLASAPAATPVYAQQPPSGTLLISNMDDNSVWLVDLPSGERRARIATRAAPHEIALASDGATAAVTNYGQPGAGNLVQILDVPRGTVVRELVVDGYERLHGAAFLPGDSLLALSSERTNEVLVVSAADGAVRRVVSTDGRVPHMIALGGPWIWAANMVEGTVSRLDPQGRIATQSWPAGTRTEGIATTPDGAEGWTGSMEGGSVVGIDAASGETVARVSGLGVPYRLAITSDARTVAVSDPGAGELVLIDRASGAVRQRIDIDAAALASGLGEESSPQGFTLSPDGQWAFVSAKAVDRVAVVHLPTARVWRFVTSGAGPDGIAFSPVGAS